MRENRFESRNQDPRQADITTLASALHEDWRSSRALGDGTFEPRIKPTHDQAWIAVRNTDQVDIANTSFTDLPADWQAENAAAAEVIVDLMAHAGRIDLSNPEHREYVGNVVHNAWLSRPNNAWAHGSEVDVPFAQLSLGEQEKDIDQVRIAQQVFGQ